MIVAPTLGLGWTCPSAAVGARPRSPGDIVLSAGHDPSSAEPLASRTRLRAPADVSLEVQFPIGLVCWSCDRRTTLASTDVADHARAGRRCNRAIRHRRVGLPGVHALFGRGHFTVAAPWSGPARARRAFGLQPRPTLPTTGGRIAVATSRRTGAAVRAALDPGPGRPVVSRGPGDEARLCSGGHGTLENRDDLVVEAELTRAAVGRAVGRAAVAGRSRRGHGGSPSAPIPTTTPKSSAPRCATSGACRMCPEYLGLPLRHGSAHHTQCRPPADPSGAEPHRGRFSPGPRRSWTMQDQVSRPGARMLELEPGCGRLQPHRLHRLLRAVP